MLTDRTLLGSAATTQQLVADAADEEVISREMLKALAYREAMRQKKHGELAARAKAYTEKKKKDAVRLSRRCSFAGRCSFAAPSVTVLYNALPPRNKLCN